MSSSVQVAGMDDFFAAVDAELAHMETGAVNALTEAVEGTFDDSQAAVPYDDKTKHESGYVHLKDSAEKEVDTANLEGSVSYGTDHNWYIEMGTSRMAAQPYLNPAFESNAQKFEKACEDLIS